MKRVQGTTHSGSVRTLRGFRPASRCFGMSSAAPAQSPACARGDPEVRGPEVPIKVPTTVPIGSRAVLTGR